MSSWIGNLTCGWVQLIELTVQSHIFRFLAETSGFHTCNLGLSWQYCYCLQCQCGNKWVFFISTISSKYTHLLVAINIVILLHWTCPGSVSLIFVWCGKMWMYEHDWKLIIIDGFPSRSNICLLLFPVKNVSTPWPPVPPARKPWEWPPGTVLTTGFSPVAHTRSNGPSPVIHPRSWPPCIPTMPISRDYSRLPKSASGRQPVWPWWPSIPVMLIPTSPTVCPRW